MFNKKFGIYQGPIFLATLTSLFIPIYVIIFSYVYDDPIPNQANVKGLFFCVSLNWLIMFNLCGLFFKHHHLLLSKSILRIICILYFSFFILGLILTQLGKVNPSILAYSFFGVLMLLSSINWYIQIKKDITNRLTRTR